MAKNLKEFITIERVQKVVAPVIIGTVLAVGAVMSFVQIRQQEARRRKWVLPVSIIVALVVAGAIGALVEWTVNAQPALECINGAYTATDGMVTCQAVFSSTLPDGATARCNDGAYSFNHNQSMLCSRHGGVAAQL